MKRLFAIMLLVCGLTYGQTPVINAPRIFQAPTGFTGNIVTLKVGGVTYFGVSSTKATFAVPILPSVAAGVDLGSTTLPFKDIYIAGTSGTPAANNFRITGASTDGMRTVYFPDADTQTVRANAGAAHEFFTSLATTGIFSRAQPAFTDISGIAATTQGGTGANLSGAGAGTYPKSNGATPAVYGASTLAASGVGTPIACTNQFVTGFTLAGDAAPTSTCTSIVAGDLGTTLTPQFARVGAGQAADATAPVAGTIDSATTNTILDVLKLTRSTTGTAGNGIGTGLVLYAEDASGNIEEAGRFQASFPNATHATQTGRVDITAMGAAAGTGISVLQDGNVGIGTALPVGRLQTKFTATTPIIFATGDTLGSYTSVTFPTANKDYANKTGICTSCAVGDLVIITAGTGAYTGQYSVLLKISDNSIQLSRTCHNEVGDIVDGAVSIVGQPRASFGSNRHFFFSELNSASGNENAFVLNYRVNKVAGNSTGLQINATHDLAPGTNYPFQVTMGGVVRAYIDSVGNTYFASTMSASNMNGNTWTLNPGNRISGIYSSTGDLAGGDLTLYSGRAGSGATNKAGGNLIAQAQIGTGSAAGSQFIVQTPTPIGTGTTDQTLANRLVADNTGAAFASGIAGLPVTLTDAAISVFDITLAAGTRTGGTFSYSIDVWDGTDGQVLSGVCTWAAVNKGGVYTDTTTCDAANDAKAVSAGTLTATWALVDDTNKMIMKVTPAGSLTETTYKVYVSILNKTPAQITMY